ncbi:probable arginine--tRNA ligase, mitochondrial [Toxorhynchites rutilus septentrionalis]|uniref:probable arginine--tRNA ligase, mitochondrial n=1 Tax=Toxorhynchites rutilus septentrionalis TaxID=329112 RepID=UPI00247A7643|nr:probable arginine--tRNA ligase, mitochondrial [Toxorhynchites rutilus septentrionalis]
MNPKMYSYRQMIACRLSQITGRIAGNFKINLCVSKISQDPEIQLFLEPNLLNTESNCNRCIRSLANLETDIEDVRLDRNENKIVLRLHRQKFIQSAFHDFTYSRLKLYKRPKTSIEFSSPNIAKPFHAGHLRSTIIGNFLANLYDHLGHQVTKINYLGDWGTHMGYLKLGVDLKNLTENEIKQNPIEKLRQAYVHAYKQAEYDEELHSKAKQIFCDLENAESNTLHSWDNFRTYAVNELERMYKRLGISFDYYYWESQYRANNISDVISLLESRNLLHTQHDGSRTIKVENRVVPMMKSDGSTLYLTRDVAALIDRQQRFNFDNIMYVVDNGQSDHFNALVSIAHQLNLPCASKISHVKFGRVLGMSTRKGTSVLLDDILDEADSLMKNKQLNTKTTKIDVHRNPEVSAILGTTAVIINDLKQQRMRNYDFNWDKALQVEGDSGIKLQYTHCRLWSLQQNVESTNQTECIPEMFPEKEALDLICTIVKFGDILVESEEKREACVLVNYLFGLCNAINRAMRVLHVKNEPYREKQIQRLQLFVLARKVLQRGMEILGLKPLLNM